MKKRILFIYTNYSSFVKADNEILTSKFEVVKYQFKPVKGLLKNAFQFIKQFLFLLFNVWKYDVFYIWFADYHSFLPVLFCKLISKKTYLIIGGFDAVAIPEIQFGVFYKKNMRSKMVAFCYKYANYILPVDSSLIKSINYYNNPEGQKIGFMNYVKRINGDIFTIPTGYDPEKWKRRPSNIERDIITVGGCDNMQSFKRKGHELFIKVARAMPDKTFSLIGIADEIQEHIRSSLPSNLKMIGFLSQEEIINQFSKHKVFTQFSLSEGLPNTLCEAMLCGCIPVGSSVNGIPEGIGDTGFVIFRPDVNEAVEAIKKALNESTDMQNKVRQRIIDLYNFDKRKDAIIKLIG